MARIRSLKPGFFTNEHLAELPFSHRLCFAGLWTLADREGRLEDRPRRIKAALFPYDEVDVDQMLTALSERGFITRYVADGVAYLAIPTFLQHQRPKTDETVSAIPAPVLAEPRGIVTAPRSYNGQRDPDRGQGNGADGAPATSAIAAATQRQAEDSFQLLWNDTTHAPIPRCRDLTTKRRRHIRARLTERDWPEWGNIFARIERSAFCRGQNDRGWVASFDWVIGSPDVGVKVLEGKYDNRHPQRPMPVGSVRYEWDCPHTPRCGSPSACHTLVVLEEARAEKAASK